MQRLLILLVTLLLFQGCSKEELVGIPESDSNAEASSVAGGGDNGGGGAGEEQKDKDLCDKNDPDAEGCDEYDDQEDGSSEEQEHNDDSDSEDEDSGSRDHGSRDHGSRDHGSRDHGSRDHGSRDHDSSSRDHDSHDCDSASSDGDEDQGLTGGHFDLDTSTNVYGPSEGTTDKHIHTYDDKYDVTGADFFNLLHEDLGEINEDISNLDQKFVLIVGNATLSPGGMISINGVTQNVVDYQNIQGDFTNLTIYSLSGIDGSVKLSELKINFSVDAIENGGLVPTQTGCVRKNDPSKDGHYRNGALLIQALSADQFSINPDTGTAALNQGGLLWEGLVFWHKKDAGCQ